MVFRKRLFLMLMAVMAKGLLYYVKMIRSVMWKFNFFCFVAWPTFYVSDCFSIGNSKSSMEVYEV